MPAMGERIRKKTRSKLHEAFVGEAKARIRLSAFAREAEEEGYR